MASAASKARSAASKTAATAKRAAANQAQAQARQGSGKSAAQNRAEFVAAQKKARGRDLSITLSENLRFGDTAQPAVQYRRQVGRDEGGGRPPTTQEQVIQSQSRVQGVPVEQITKRKGEAKSVEFREELSFGEKREKPQGVSSPIAGGFLYGAERIAILRKDTEEERRQRDLITQISVGAAEGLGGLGASITSFGIASAKEIEGLVKGKGLGQSKEFVEYVKGELRPSTISQAFSQIDPFAEKRLPISFDPTSVSRGVGELASFAFGGGTVKITGVKGLPRTPGKFTSTKIPMGEEGITTYPLISPPYKSIYQPQLTSRIKLGKGPGKIILREPTPRRSPFMEDKAGPSSGAKLFGETKVSLGKGASQFIRGTQTQRGGLQTIVKQKTVAKPQQDILFSKPRFEESQYRQSAGGYVTETIRYPKGVPSTISQGGLQTTMRSTSQKDIEKQYKETLSPTKTQQKIEPGLKTVLSRGQIGKEKFGLRDELSLLRITKPQDTFKLRDELGLTTRSGYKEGFKFREDLTTKLIPGQRFEPPYYPPPREPILAPPRFGFPFGAPGTSLGSYGFDDAKGTKKLYNAYGISEDINVKQLAKFSYFGSPKIFKQLEAADRKAINAYYGIKTRKTKKAKSKRGKRK